MQMLKAISKFADPLKFVVVLALMVQCVGCGTDKATVTGSVTRADGSPLADARVVFRSPATGASARGVTDSEGRYTLGTLEKGDGIPPGEYKVVIGEDRGSWDAPAPRTVHARYEKSSTTDLTATIEPGATKELHFVLDPP